MNLTSDRDTSTRTFVRIPESGRTRYGASPGPARVPETSGRQSTSEGADSKV